MAGMGTQLEFEIKQQGQLVSNIITIIANIVRKMLALSQRKISKVRC